MNYKELRIGNIIKQGVIGKISCDNHSLLDLEVLTPEGKIERVLKPEGELLTAEWLIEFGFRKYSGSTKEYTDYRLDFENWCFRYDAINRSNPSSWSGIKFSINADGGYDEHGEYDLIHIVKYVHQLQNLFYFLTGKDLEMKRALEPPKTGRIKNVKIHYKKRFAE